MAKVKVRMNPAGARAVLNAPGVVADLKSRAQRIKQAAVASHPALTDADIAVGAQTGKRAHVGVVTATRKAVNINRAHNTLLKALDSGSG